ncbi:MAG TPA: MOSC domain-containing protein, partial [Burkholderiaceae bacterium]|nr:MOSC domain-containing protein [Burkholderiaceae bacterium]
RVWDDTLEALDCDDITAAWFSNALGTPCRLVRFHPDARRIASLDWTGGVEAPTLFADGFPLLVISQWSLDDLNRKLQAQGRAPLPMNRFRPSLVIDGVEAFEEDFAASIRIGAARIKPVKPCPRCPIPSVDQVTGTTGPDPLDILRTYRANPKLDGGIAFGMNAIVLEGAGQVLRVGQEVEVELAL